MNFEHIQVLMSVLTLISIIFGVRGHLKSYQREDSARATETALFTERISNINLKLDNVVSRIAEVEKTQQEVLILRVQITTIGEEMKTVKQNVDKIVKHLLEKITVARP